MAQNTTKEIPAEDWTQLTDADIVSITFQNLSSNFILIRATTDTTKPTGLNDAIRYNPGQGERNVMLSDLFPGLAGRDRLWAYSPTPARIFVSHA